MESIKTINEFNDYLVENKINIMILEYVKKINELKYNIDISFIDELLELVIRDECCIHHKMLVKYDVVTLKSGTTDIKNLIKQYDLIQDQEWLIRKVSDKLKSGTKYKNEYYFHPKKMLRIFSLCNAKLGEHSSLLFYDIIRKYFFVERTKFAELCIAKRDTFRRKVFLMHLKYVL